MNATNVGQVKLISSYGRLLQAHSDNGEMHASQDPDKVGAEERWNVFRWDDGLISLANYSNTRFLTCTDQGQAVADRAQAGPWERWTLVAAGDGLHIGLRSWRNTYLCGQAPGNDTRWGGEVIADRGVMSTWETWQMLP